jgi:hypothetical protein
MRNADKIYRNTQWYKKLLKNFKYEMDFYLYV